MLNGRIEQPPGRQERSPQAVCGHVTQTAVKQTDLLLKQNGLWLRFGLRGNCPGRLDAARTHSILELPRCLIVEEMRCRTPASFSSVVKSGTLNAGTADDFCWSPAAACKCRFVPRAPCRVTTGRRFCLAGDAEFSAKWLFGEGCAESVETADCAGRCGDVEAGWTFPHSWQT